MLNLTEDEIKQTWSKSSYDISVSVCCITYNQEMYIATAIESFLMQRTNFPFEIIISDDMSSDKTNEIIEAYARNYPSIIKHINNKKNVGANLNLLKTFSHSLGQYIAICEGDDYWIDKNKLQKQYDIMQGFPESLFSFHSCLLDENGSLNKKVSFNKGSDHLLLTVDDVLQSLNQFSPTASYMFHHKVVEMLPAWFHSAPVGDLFIELYGMRKAPGIYIPLPMSVYRVSSLGSWSAETQKETEVHRLRHLKMIDYLELAAGDFPEYKLSFQRKVAHVYMSLAVRAIKEKDYKSFKQFLDSANNSFKYISVKHRIYHSLKYAPFVILFALNMKKMLSKKAGEF